MRKISSKIRAGELFVIAAGVSVENGQRKYGNYLARVSRGKDKPKFQRIEIENPFGSFFTNTPRGGSKPSDIIDVFGIADDSPNLRYARIHIEP